MDFFPCLCLVFYSEGVSRKSSRRGAGQLPAALLVRLLATATSSRTKLLRSPRCHQPGVRGRQLDHWNRPSQHREPARQSLRARKTSRGSSGKRLSSVSERRRHRIPEPVSNFLNAEQKSALVSVTKITNPLWSGLLTYRLLRRYFAVFRWTCFAARQSPV